MFVLLFSGSIQTCSAKQGQCSVFQGSQTLGLMLTAVPAEICIQY